MAEVYIAPSPARSFVRSLRREYPLSSQIVWTLPPAVYRMVIGHIRSHTEFLEKLCTTNVTTRRILPVKEIHMTTLRATTQKEQLSVTRRCLLVAAKPRCVDVTRSSSLLGLLQPLESQHGGLCTLRRRCGSSPIDHTVARLKFVCGNSVSQWLI